MCIKAVFESINSIRHNDIVTKAMLHVYDMITEKILPQFVSTSTKTNDRLHATGLRCLFL